jgi:hypothetical protein
VRRCAHNFRFYFAYTDFMSRRRQENYTRVYLRFRRHGSAWKCEFLVDGSGAPLPRTLTFANPDKITELAKRGDGLPTLESRQMLELGIQAGRGGIFLRLSGEQLANLRSPK